MIIRRGSIFIILTAVFAACNYPAVARFLPLEKGNEPFGLEIYFPHARLYEGESARAAAMIIHSDGTKSEAAPADVIWENGDREVAAVESDGTVNGRKMGACEIRAAVWGMTASCEIEVLRSVDYGRLMVSEVFYDAAGSDDGREFIEIYNDNDYPCDISGMKLVDGATSSSPFHFPAGSFIGAKEHAVVAQSGDGFLALFGFPARFAGFSFSLNNAGETVLFMKADGSPVDQVFIKGGVPENPAPETWGSILLPSALAGGSVQRLENRDTDTCADWTGGPPTPGQ